MSVLLKIFYNDHINSLKIWDSYSLKFSSFAFFVNDHTDSLNIWDSQNKRNFEYFNCFLESHTCSKFWSFMVLLYFQIYYTSKYIILATVTPQKLCTLYRKHTSIEFFCFSTFLQRSSYQPISLKFVARSIFCTFVVVTSNSCLAQYFQPTHTVQYIAGTNRARARSPVFHFRDLPEFRCWDGNLFFRLWWVVFCSGPKYHLL